MELSFNINYQTNFGESLVVVGNHEAFGNWNPRSSNVTLSYTDGATWTGKVKLAAEAVGDLRYKYVVLTETGERWEEGEDRRVVLPKSKLAETRAVLHEHWGATDEWRQVTGAEPEGKAEVDVPPRSPPAKTGAPVAAPAAAATATGATPAPAQSSAPAATAPVAAVPAETEEGDGAADKPEEKARPNQPNQQQGGKKKNKNRK